MRGYFAYYLYKEMQKNKDIVVITADLGYKMYDDIQNTFSGRYYMVGAGEQGAVGLAIGLALSGKIPIVYSISPFLLYRPFEALRLYIDREKIPVKLVGSGRDKDYNQDGFSHWAHDDVKIISNLANIVMLRPDKKEEIEEVVQRLVHTDQPIYLNLRR